MSNRFNRIHASQMSTGLQGPSSGRAASPRPSPGLPGPPPRASLDLQSPHPGPLPEGEGDKRALACLFLAVCRTRADVCQDAVAQIPTTRFGEAVPRDVREMYDRGLQYLAKTQSENGDWPGGGGENGPGTTGMAMMVFLACGEDPNFGPYSNHIRKAVRNMIRGQDAGTGIMGPSMYHHGFATLALAEAYGVVDERSLWTDGKAPRSIGQALELAVRGAVTSQKKNPLGRLALFTRRCAMPTRP